MTKSYFAHPTAVIDGESEENGFCDPNIGKGTKIWHHAHIMSGARIGENCIIGQNCFIGSDVVIGNGCKLQNNVNVYDGVTLEDFVFCGPSMTFTNLSTPIPRAHIPRRYAFQKTIVRRFASIGAGAVIVCGHELGEACFVAGGAVVTQDVPPYALVAGVPAKIKGFVCECGARLHFENGFAHCKAEYELQGKRVVCNRRYEMLEKDLIRQIRSSK